MRRFTLLLLLLILALAGCAPAQLPAAVANPAVTPAPAATAQPLSPSSVPEPSPTLAPTPEPTPAPTPEPDPILARVQALSDRELIGQLVMCGFDGAKAVPEQFAALMEEYKIGNVILFGWNIQTFAQTEKLCQSINEANPTPDIPLFIATDVEGGSVVRFQWKPWPKSARTLGKNGDADVAYEQFLKIGAKLRETGINMDLAPVLDIAKNPDSTFLGQDKRILGSDPEKAAPIADACIRGIQDGGALSVGKHFPGHGGTKTDSHHATPVIEKSLEELEAYEFRMFRSAIESGIGGMLVGHMRYPQVDAENVTSVSEKFITGILREDMGFDGVIMSDDMRMQGITREMSCGEGAVRFLQAGGDLVLIGRYQEKQRDVLDSIAAALESGALTRERLEQSACRILRAKAQYAGYALG